MKMNPYVGFVTVNFQYFFPIIYSYICRLYEELNGNKYDFFLGKSCQNFAIDVSHVVNWFQYVIVSHKNGVC
jgi:hypothetical protein